MQASSFQQDIKSDLLEEDMDIFSVKGGEIDLLEAEKKSPGKYVVIDMENNIKPVGEYVFIRRAEAMQKCMQYTRGNKDICEIWVRPANKYQLTYWDRMVNHVPIPHTAKPAIQE